MAVSRDLTSFSWEHFHKNQTAVTLHMASARLSGLRDKTREMEEMVVSSNNLCCDAIAIL